MNSVIFNYSIGDTVTLIREPSWDNRALLNYDKEFKPKEYRIRALKYVIDKDGEKILYSLNAYCDEYLQYHNWIDESYFQGNGNKKVENIEFMSVDNKCLKIGDKIYTSIYYGSPGRYYISPDLHFTNYGTITKLSYIQEGILLNDGSYRISEIYDGVASAIKYWIKGENYIDYKYSFISKSAVKEIDDKFIEDYIEACKEYKFNPFNGNIDDNDKNNCFEWLNFMGIYDKVKENYKKIAVRKRVKVEKDTTVDDILSKLTDKQKKELLKKLSK